MSCLDLAFLPSRDSPELDRFWTLRIRGTLLDIASLELKQTYAYLLDASAVLGFKLFQANLGFPRLVCEFGLSNLPPCLSHCNCLICLRHETLFGNV
jgi:hypothetical protein